MKYVCLGYYDKSKHDAMTEAEKQAMFDACFTYDDHLRANGHWVGGEPIQPAETALTLYWKNGKSSPLVGSDLPAGQRSWADCGESGNNRRPEIQEDGGEGLQSF